MQDTQEGPFWKGTDHPYTCNIASPKKESKFHGMKSFIAYQVTPSVSNPAEYFKKIILVPMYETCQPKRYILHRYQIQCQLHLSFVFQFSNIQVSRRYKHFDWLHERLLEKFSCIVIPPLPDKQISGKANNGAPDFLTTSNNKAFTQYVKDCKLCCSQRSK